MPMRGTLPLVSQSVESRAAANLAQAFLAAVGSTDLVVVSAFSTIGLFASLWFELAHPLGFILLSTLTP
jgi:hypothetical protein